jgi:2-polyprenyl-3-methyl-5-hydroxy-6-metoxy-1,4-benzoquinol methylase
MQKKNVMDYSTENYVIQEGTEAWKNHANSKIIEAYHEHIFGDVLDVGCNTGGVTYWLHKNEKVKSITGIDINPNVENIFRKHMKDLHINVEFFACNYTKNCLRDKQFDTIISFHTLEHIFPEHAVKFASNLANNLKTAGKFVTSIPYKKEYKDEHHRAFYDEASLVSLLKKAGLKCIECFPDTRWHEINLLTGLFIKQ